MSDLEYDPDMASCTTALALPRGPGRNAHDPEFLGHVRRMEVDDVLKWPIVWADKGTRVKHPLLQMIDNENQNSKHGCKYARVTWGDVVYVIRAA